MYYSTYIRYFFHHYVYILDVLYGGNNVVKRLFAITNMKCCDSQSFFVYTVQSKVLYNFVDRRRVTLSCLDCAVLTKTKTRLCVFPNSSLKMSMASRK